MIKFVHFVTRHVKHALENRKQIVYYAIHFLIEFLMLLQGSVFAPKIHILMSHPASAPLIRKIVILNADLVPVLLNMNVPAAILSQTLDIW